VGIGIGHYNDGKPDYMFLEDDEYIKIGKLWIAFDAIKGHINDQGSWARDACAALPPEDKDATIRNIATFSINLVDGLNQVRAEREFNNEARLQDSPPVFPIQMANILSTDFFSKF
jgi:hypothetical protein